MSSAKDEHPAHRAPGVQTIELVDHPGRIFVATYGDPPDPPATAALIATLVSGGLRA
jgi:hypothetical protein